MTEITVDVVSGLVRPIPVPLTSADIVLLSGDCYFCGWSIREASGETASDAQGFVVAPGAGAAIATSPSQVGGTYTLNWTVELIGAAAAGDQNNFGLYVNAVLVATSVNLPAAGEYPQPPVQVVIPNGTTYQVKAIGAGTAGVTYGASVSAVPVAIGDAVVEFRDGLNPLAEVSLPANGSNSQSWGQIGHQIKSDIRVHVIAGIVAGTISARFAKSGGE